MDLVQIMEDAIVLRGITKSFGDKVAVDNLDVAIPRGTLCGFIGPNGAGKTTTIRMIMSILFPDRGEITVLGKASALNAKDRIGYLPEERGLYRKMKVGAFLKYIGGLKGVALGRLKSSIPDWLARLGLEGVEGKKCEDLSKGMQQKVQVIASLLHAPDLLVLDEPFTGLDPLSTRSLRGLFLEEQQRGATIIFSTHMMAEAEQLCERVVMIHQGRKVLDQSVAEIHTRYDPRSVLFEPLDPAADVGALRSLPCVISIASHNDAYEIKLAENANLASAMRDMTAAVAPALLQVRRPTLEDVFVRIASESSEPGTAQVKEAVETSIEKERRSR